MAGYELSRVFGDASLRWDTDESGNPVLGLVSDNYRGFEVICQGAHGEFLPDLLSRRCGVDSLYHRIGACVALERAIGVEVPDTGRKVRELLLSCQLFRRHSLTMALHVLPDLLFPASDPNVRNLVGLFKVDRDVVRRMMALGSLGEGMLRHLCRRTVHPVCPVPGGITALPGEEAIRSLRDLLSEAMQLAKEASRLVRMLLRRNEELVGELRNPACIQIAGETPPFGNSWEGFKVSGLREGVSPATEGELLGLVEKVGMRHTMLGACQLAGEVEKEILTGPLARINLAGAYGSESADSELEELKKVWGFPFEGILLSHALRLAEMIMAVERAHRIISEYPYWEREELRNEVLSGSGRGVVVLEGAEGIHIYGVTVEEGYVSGVEYLSPLQWNLRALLTILRGEVTKAKGEMEESRRRIRLGLSVRAFAPCFYCAGG